MGAAHIRRSLAVAAARLSPVPARWDPMFAQPDRMRPSEAVVAKGFLTEPPALCAMAM